MPELLTPPRRNERVGPTATPAISVRFLASEIWISREARIAAGAWLRNVGVEVARRIEIPELVVDEGVRCRFRPVEDLEPGDEASIDPVFCLAADKGHLEDITLAGVISRSVVNRVLAGRALRTHWTLRVTYEDVEGRQYESVNDIEVLGLPLSVAVARTRTSER